MANRFDNGSISAYTPETFEELAFLPMLKRKKHDNLLAQQELMRAGLAKVDPYDKHFNEAIRIKQDLEKEQEQKVNELDSHKLENNDNSSNEGEEESQQESEESDEGESDKSQPSESQTEQSERTQGESVSNTPKGSSNEPKIRTEETLRQKIEELVNLSGGENVYVEIPKVNLDTVIAKNSEVHEYIDDYFLNQQNVKDDWSKINQLSNHNIYEQSDKLFKEFKNSAQKEVNYLVKEFECRKAADSYARISISRTGVLDTTRLHTYKYNEDLFKKINVIPDGKNHGLIFILDWSGSMQTVLKDTCKQLYNLIWFCKKASIPFEVLQKIPFHTHKFRVITFEHDHYADDTQSIKDKSRKYLQSFGYELVVSNVSPDDYCDYEDWWVHPDLVDRKIINIMKATDDAIKKIDKYIYT